MAVSVFLASLAATTLQITLGQPPSTIIQTTNFFWYTTIVLSIMTVVSCLLASAWEAEETCATPSSRTFTGDILSMRLILNVLGTDQTRSNHQSSYTFG